MVTFIFSIALLSSGSLIEESPAPPTNIAELRERIKEVLRETRTPGAGVAVVRREGTEWVEGIGLADVTTARPVTPETLFRIGSVSKAFVALSILKLQQEGKLTLNDLVRAQVPEIAFTNRWEETDPVRIVHLLEHTAGFDDRALRELASSDPKPLTLSEGLAFHPASRTVRWPPGRYFSYSNPGPAVAAYIVEKVSQTRFEDFVAEHWFRPLGMLTAGYFLTPQTERQLTKLYRTDGRTEVPYWHNLHRPSGAISASARDMANFVRFFINRGSFEGVTLLPAEAIERMERPESSLAVREGVKTGYGLCNYTSVKGGFTYQGHNGGMGGARSEFAYLPDAGVGYSWMINSENEIAADRIDALIRAYITRTLTKPESPKAIEELSASIAREYRGWYEPIALRNESMRFAQRILGLTRLQFEGRTLILRPLCGAALSYVAQGERLFRFNDNPIPSLVLAKDRAEGTLILTSRQSLRRIPAWLAWIEIAVPALTVLFSLTSVILALVVTARTVFRRSSGAVGFSVRWLPFLSVLAWGASFGIFVSASTDIVGRLGNKTPWSIGFCATTVLFALFSMWGLIAVIRHRRTAVSRLVWGHACVSSLLFSVVALYLAWWGVIGLRTWK